MGNLEATVRAIVSRSEQAAKEAAQDGGKKKKPPPGIQVVAVCGRNKKLAQELNSASWLPRGARVLATGFVENMEEWMAASDVIVTKAGARLIRFFFWFLSRSKRSVAARFSSFSFKTHPFLL